uniref:Cyclic nucleotide-binding domain-containing protein n=1 Tax=Tetradesmus obliquus TaxID=3088 RepID=A0A383VMP3_TETOB
MKHSPATELQSVAATGQLATAKVELYMPKVDVVTAGDQVNELMLIVAGEAVAISSSSSAGCALPDGLSLAVDDGAGDTSSGGSWWEVHGGDGGRQHEVHGGGGGRRSEVPGARARLLGAGDPAGEMAFFTETPCMESVRTTGMCRVLVIPRALYHALAGDFASSTRAVLDNLLARAEQMIEAEFPGCSAASITSQLDSLSAQQQQQQQGASPAEGEGLLHSNAASTMAPEAWAAGTPAAAVAAAAGRGPTAAGAGAAAAQLPPLPPVDPWRLPLRNEQQRVVLSNLLRVRALVQGTLARLEQQQTHEFLNACSTGNIDLIRTMLRQGRNVNCCDYDGRTGLMLASSKGHGLAVSLLLRSGAAPNAADLAGSSALLEAARGAHDETLQVLLRAGARLQMSEVRQAALLCSAVSEGDLQLLRRLLAAGANPNAGDYDKRRPLHIAAADGNLPAVRLLVEVGAADPSLMDRWQQTPLQEASRSGAAPLVSYLSGKTPAAAPPAIPAAAAPSVAAEPLKPQKQQHLPELPAWAGPDSLQALAQLGSQGRLAAVAQLLEQQLSLVRLLVEEGGAAVPAAAAAAAGALPAAVAGS